MMQPEEGTVRAHSLNIVRIGGVPAGLAETLVMRLSRRVALPCRVAATDLQGELPWLAERPNQVDADALLRRLEEEARGGGAFLVGLAAVDLAIPIFTFVFGRARHRGSAAIVSVHRLAPEFYGLPPDLEVTLRRATDEVVHEVGHLAGLRHCHDHACIMHFAASVEAVDLRGPAFCPACRSDLPAHLLADARD